MKYCKRGAVWKKENIAMGEQAYIPGWVTLEDFVQSGALYVQIFLPEGCLC